MKEKAHRVWAVSFELDDDGAEGGYFSKKEITDMVEGIQTAGLVVQGLSIVKQ